MKMHLLATLAVTSLGLAAPLVASAQSAPPAGFQALSGLPSPDEVVNGLSDKLALSPDQKAAIAPIIADRQQKLKALAADTDSRPRQRRSQMREQLRERVRQQRQ